MNYQGGLTQAYNQFIADLKKDKDFISFKKKAYDIKTGHSYGVIVVRTNKFIIDSKAATEQ